MLGYLFPGQGTVRIGMGAWLRRRPAARERLDRFDALLTRPISPLCARGPMERLVATEHAQVAVTACNLAALTVLEEEGYEPAVVAGHSVGELSALHAAGVLTFDDTVRLVGIRARLMAGVGETGGMRAVMGLPVEQVEDLAEAACAPGEPVVVGLENAPGHVVVSGALPALDRLAALATAATKIVALRVGNAFHSPLMAAAVPGWAEAVREAPMREPRVPVVPNVTGEPTTDLGTLREALIAQLTGRVLWTRTVTAIDAVAPGVEVGDSKVLAGLSRRAEARCLSMADPGTLRRLAKTVAA
ncbi:ACP S-malonyltransferase [Planomonospora venezuelensis]|uniref:Malonyl CoA-acyl carrier protein transacylase n=1 Tax=Planomonospora venezuelensis TaxID=1999 RepID=A0A841D336_PLAVE|nr:ACP S-malonyltransferase [Planomonospora venezuelensis]MBB5961916.1 [acyl-carrier-protein] S-malonyltransferase [Planomonospora venezuelensis]GIM98940.1 malonyl CoA-acyl carrier protein transacylase [Planomonospora venezuelensis]